MWDRMLPYLGDRDVQVPALPGHAGGPPYTGDLMGWLDARVDAPVHVVGNSLGGWLALAAHHPEADRPLEAAQFVVGSTS